MSIAGKLREAQEANEALNEKLAKIEAEHKSALESVKNKDAEIEQLKAAAVEAQDKLTGLESQVAEKDKTIADMQAQRDAEKARSESAEKKLENPAFAHASEGASDAPDVDPGTDGKTAQQFLAEYQGETDPAKRAAMWRVFYERG